MHSLGAHAHTHQGFNWESSKHSWWRTLRGQVQQIKDDGITGIWLPPCSQALSEQVRAGSPGPVPSHHGAVPRGGRHHGAVPIPPPY